MPFGKMKEVCFITLAGWLAGRQEYPSGS